MKERSRNTATIRKISILFAYNPPKTAWPADRERGRARSRKFRPARIICHSICKIIKSPSHSYITPKSNNRFLHISKPKSSLFPPKSVKAESFPPKKKQPPLLRRCPTAPGAMRALPQGVRHACRIRPNGLFNACRRTPGFGAGLSFGPRFLHAREKRHSTNSNRISPILLRFPLSSSFRARAAKLCGNPCLSLDSKNYGSL